MSPQEFANRMRKCWESGDTEGNHGEADDLLCEVLSTLGYTEGVDIFQNAEKWYA